MLGVDVGGTFTDVVAIRDGRIQVTKVPSDRDRPAAAVVEGARQLGVEGSAVFNHASTMGINAVITRRLPKIAFLTTQGFRDMLDRRPRVAPARRPRPTRAGAARSATPPKPLVPRYLRRGIERAAACRRQRPDPLDEDQARKQLAVLERCASRVWRFACSTRTSIQPMSIAFASSRGRCSAAFRSRSPLTPPRSPRSTPRASTTVVDVFMKVHLHRVLAGARRRRCAGSASPATSTSPTAPRPCCRGRRHWSSRSGSSLPGLRRERSRARVFGDAIGDGNLLCADVGGASTDVSLIVDGQPFVNNDVRARARPHHQCALRRDLGASVPGEAASLRSRRPATSRWGPAAQARCPGPPATGGGGTDQPFGRRAC